MNNSHPYHPMGKETPDPLRVAILYRMDHPGGVQSCVYSLIKGLNRRGIVPDILWDIQPDWKYLENLNLRAGFRPIRFRFPTKWITRFPNTLRYLLWIFNVYRGDSLGYEYDFIYIFYNGFLLSSGIPHLRYLSGPPLIPELKQSSPGLRGAPYRSFQWVYRNVLRRLSPVYEVHKGSRYVINSEYTGELFYRAHGVRLPVVHPPIDFSGRDFQPNDWRHRDSLTFFSRFIGYKRPEWVLELVQRHPHLRCVLMGGVPENRRGYYEKLQKQAAQMGIKNVVFLANPSNERVREELARTRFYVFPARNEHFGMTTPEAIASGAIPFVHNSGGQIEIVNDEKLRFVDSDFFEKFDELTRMSDVNLENLRDKLLERIRKFSEDTYIAKMLDYLDQIPRVENLLAYKEFSSLDTKSNGKAGYQVLNQ